MGKQRTAAVLAACVLALVGVSCSDAGDQVVQTGHEGGDSAVTPSTSGEDASLGLASGGDALAFRDAVLATNDDTTRYPPPASVRGLMGQSEAVIVGDLKAVTLQPTPESATGPVATPDASELWLIADVVVTDVVAGADIKVGDTVTWAFVAWMGADAEAADAARELEGSLISSAPLGASTTLFLHHSRAVPGWWSHSNGAGALLDDGRSVVTLHPQLAPGSSGIFDRPGEVRTEAVTASGELGTSFGLSVPE
ncbi:MAG: hypothetical protein WHS89_13680 [Acidimicrobiales bacterium]|jgi:hypothetical protein